MNRAGFGLRLWVGTATLCAAATAAAPLAAQTTTRPTTATTAPPTSTATTASAPTRPPATTAPVTQPVATTAPATRPVATTTVASTAPATAPLPTTVAAPVAPPAPPPPPAPLPSPKAVALAFVTSLDKADATVARALVPPDEARVRWVDAGIALSAALKRLDAAAVARFGEAGRAVSRGQLHLGESLKSLEQAQEKIEGDAATLTIPGSARTIRLTKIDGTWRIAGPADGEVAGQIALYARLARAADVAAEQIVGGGYPDVAAAARGFAARVTEARLGVSAPGGPALD